MLYGQGTSGSLTGQVSDPSGAAVANATVSLKNVDTDYFQTATSNNSGVYLLKPVMPGNYTLTIAAKGFAAYVQKGIVITANLDATQDVQLKLASAANETVIVTSNAELINTTSAELGSTVNEAAISELPLDGRDPSSLVLLAPGTVNVLNHGGEGIQTGFSFPTETGASSSGGRQGSTFYMLDGVTNMDNYNLLASHIPQCRRHPGVQGHHQQLRRAIWLCARRGGLHRHQKRHQQLSRRRLLVRSQQRHERH